MSRGQPKQVLDVGNCDADSWSIQRQLALHFQVQCTRTETAKQALEAIARQRFDLVLVNRVLDSSGESGLELIRQIKDRPGGALLPVMLISNYDDAQRQACLLGALEGFGKAALQAPETTRRLAAILETGEPLAE